MDGYVYQNGIDGCVPVGEMPSDGCCPPDILSISPESLACNAVALLPSGPLWDASKELAIGCRGLCDDNCAEPFGDEKDMCASLVLHSIYTAKKLHYYIMGALWPAVREANPFTAYSTMDEWLDRLGWIDCYNTFCRAPELGPITPYEIIGPCGVEFCPPTFGEELTRIYKRGVIIALWRLRHGIIENLCSINFILSSLYSELVLDPNYDPATGEPPCLILRPTADFANVVLKDTGQRTETTILQGQKQVKLYLTPGHGICVGGPAKAYPLTLAAHCIVRSMLPTCCKICLVRQP
jgi:hypothetical protein